MKAASLHLGVGGRGSGPWDRTDRGELVWQVDTTQTPDAMAGQ
jgi:hypothetical protein